MGARWWEVSRPMHKLHCTYPGCGYKVKSRSAARALRLLRKHRREEHGGR